MMRFAYVFAGGAAFYPALAACIAGLAVIRFARERRWISLGRIVLTLSVILVAISATPLPFWMYLVWGLTIAVALFFLGRVETPRPWRGNAALAAALAATAALGAAELPYRFMPAIPYEDSGILYILGDSLSMGADTMDGNWPALLGRHANMEVHAFAFGGVRGLARWIGDALVRLGAHLLSPVPAALIALVALVVAVRRLRRKRSAPGKRPEAAYRVELRALLKEMDRRLQRCGIERAPHETLLRFSSRVAQEMPDAGFATAAAQWYRRYARLRFGAPPTPEQLGDLRKILPDRPMAS